MTDTGTTNPSNQPDETPKAPKTGRRRLFWIVSGLSALGLTGLFVAGAAAHHGHGPDKFKFMTARMLDAVDATPEQRENIEAIVERHTQSMDAHKEERKALRDKVHALLTADQVDAEQAETLRQSFVQLADDHSAEVTATMLQVADELTPEQRKKIAARMQKRFERRHKARGRWGKERHAQ